MKLWVLMENTACREDLTAEHGLSLYIETGDRRILFDAGQSGAFADNAEKLGVDLGAVDTAIVSHGHYDHGGGSCRFLEMNSAAPLYLSRHAFEPHFNAAGKNIGLDPALSQSDRLVFVDDMLELGKGITLYSCNGLDRPYPTDPFGLTAGAGETEDFRHEQYLLVQEGRKRILFSGCSHKGILNIARWFRPDVLVGGFHFKQLDPQDPRLTDAAHVLLAHPTVYYTGHCTGEAQFHAMKDIMGDRLHSISTGSVIEF